MTSFEVAAILRITALVHTRAQSGCATILKVPEDRRLRDLLRVWQFPKGLAKAIGIPFRYLVHPDDHHYFGETQATFAFSGSNLDADAVALARLRRTGFFGLTSYTFDDDARELSAMVPREWERWRASLVLQLLSRHLSGPAGDVARVVIYEVLANVVQHPDAQVACLVSNFEPVSNGTNGESGLTLSVWDNGADIIQTLRACLDQGSSVRLAEVEAGDEFIVHEEVDGTVRESIKDTRSTPNPDVTDATLFLSSLFPGITRKTRARTLAVPPMKDDVGTWTDHVGYGLCALYRSVVGSFGGSLAFRNAAYEMKVRAVRPDEQRGRTAIYYAKIERVPDTVPFRGNMVTVRLPARGNE